MTTTSTFPTEAMISAGEKINPNDFASHGAWVQAVLQAALQAAPSTAPTPPKVESVYQPAPREYESDIDGCEFV